MRGMLHQPLVDERPDRLPQGVARDAERLGHGNLLQRRPGRQFSAEYPLSQGGSGLVGGARSIDLKALSHYHAWAPPCWRIALTLAPWNTPSRADLCRRPGGDHRLFGVVEQSNALETDVDPVQGCCRQELRSRGIVERRETAQTRVQAVRWGIGDGEPAGSPSHPAPARYLRVITWMIPPRYPCPWRSVASEEPMKRISSITLAEIA